jgi:AcrR family transcriptional regulator
MKDMEVGQQTRDAILRSALEAFANAGYRGASLDRIAKKVGLTKGALYWHFKNKLDLYTAVVDFTFAEYERPAVKKLRRHNRGAASVGARSCSSRSTGKPSINDNVFGRIRGLTLDP